MASPPIHRVRRAVSSLWTRSPKDIWARLRRNGASRVPPWAQGKHRTWSRLAYYVWMYKQYGEAIGRPLKLRDARVLEIGAGPALGLAPFAILEGSRAYTIVEPGFTECRGDEAFRTEYLFPLHSIHGKVVAQGAPVPFDSFLAKVDAIEVVPKPIEALAGVSEPYDVVLSKSCLEHIEDLDGAARVLASITKPGSVHAHYVDFTMHYDQDRLGSPFGATYRTAKKDNPEWFGNVRSMVNLLRPSEILAAFEPHFSEVHFLRLEDHQGRLDLTQRHPDWTSYDERDLTVANAIVYAAR